MEKYKISGMYDNAKLVKEVIEARFPQEAIDKFYEKYGRIHFDEISVQFEYRGIFC